MDTSEWILPLPLVSSALLPVHSFRLLLSGKHGAVELLKTRRSVIHGT